MSDPDSPGVAVTSRVYEIARNGSEELPSEAVLRKRYGGWLSVCAEFGLQPPVLSVRGANAIRGVRSARLRGTTCPHCGKPFGISHIRTHRDRCPERPGMRERLRAILERKDVPGVAITLRQYRRRHEEGNIGKDLPTANTLEHHFGTWTKCAAWCGLQFGDDAHILEILELRRAEEEAAFAAWVAEQERQPRGVTVCGEPRVVRGLRTADGRECVAMMIR